MDAPRSALSDGPKIIVIGRQERKLWPNYWLEIGSKGGPLRPVDHNRRVALLTLEVVEPSKISGRARSHRCMLMTVCTEAGNGKKWESEGELVLVSSFAVFPWRADGAR